VETVVSTTVAETGEATISHGTVVVEVTGAIEADSALTGLASVTMAVASETMAAETGEITVTAVATETVAVAVSEVVQ